MRLLLALAIGSSLLALPVAAQPAGPAGQAAKQGALDHSRIKMPMSRGQMMMMHGGRAGPENHQAMVDMHQNMMAVSERDPGRAWAAMMIPHHQGAVDTARIVLRHSQDPELRRMAQSTIETQQRDIAELRSWLQRNRSRRR